MWLFLAAKVIERDVEKVDEIAQYEQWRLSKEEDDNDGDAIEIGGIGVIGYEGTPPSSDMILSYEHIYSQVSR